MGYTEEELAQETKYSLEDILKINLACRKEDYESLIDVYAGEYEFVTSLSCKEHDRLRELDYLIRLNDQYYSETVDKIISISDKQYMKENSTIVEQSLFDETFTRLTEDKLRLIEVGENLRKEKDALIEIAKKRYINKISGKRFKRNNMTYVLK